MERLFIINSILIWIVLALNLILTLGLIRRINKMASVSDFENIPTLAIGTQAPDFSAEALDGQLVSLATYAHQAVTFIFISPTCTPCVEKIPTLLLIEPQAEQHGVRIILVSLVDRADTQAFVNKYSITMPILVAPRETNPFAENYKAAATPFYCFVDEEGKIKSTGYFDAHWEDQLMLNWSKT